jgi:hypothetical protein
MTFVLVTVVWEKTKVICFKYLQKARGVGGRGKGRGRGQQGEMAPTMYAHMNKWIKKKILKMLTDIMLAVKADLNYYSTFV